MSYTYTNQKDLRKAFREQHPNLDFKKIKNYSGNGTMFKTDTRVAFTDWIDALEKNGDISQALAQRATLD